MWIDYTVFITVINKDMWKCTSCGSEFETEVNGKPVAGGTFVDIITKKFVSWLKCGYC